MKKTNRLTYFFLLLIIIACPLLAQVINIDNTQQYLQIIQQNNPTLVKFAADWCGVCQGVKLPFQEVAHEQEFNTVTFAQINIDTMKELTKKYDIAGVPTFIYLHNGNNLNQEVGVQNMTTFKEDLRNNLRKTFNLAQNESETKEKIRPISAPIEQKSSRKPLEKEKPQPTQGILGTIKDFFEKIVVLIGKVTKYIIDKIMGLFR